MSETNWGPSAVGKPLENSKDLESFHEPVLKAELLDFLQPGPKQFYLDGTVGGGGHARQILEACEDCLLLAVDRDLEALSVARTALSDSRDRVRFLHGRFEVASEDTEVRNRGLDGALLDLGVSSHQLDSDSRGFTFRRGVALDMRMDTSQGQDARRFLADASETLLTSVFRDFGEEPKARRLAREIVKRRMTSPLETSDDLVAALLVALGRSPSPQDKARIFQAIRIAVNEEVESLRLALPAIREVLNEGAVLIVIAYHSIEDRIVKNAFRDWSKSCICPPKFPICACRGRALGKTLTKRPIRPRPGEIEANLRARSAGMRAWRRAA